jgi:hypothetical protein
MLSREWNLSVSDLSKLHTLSKGLLDALNEHLPDRVGGAVGWNFEKAHSILQCGVGLKTLLVRALNMRISI